MSIGAGARGKFALVAILGCVVAAVALGVALGRAQAQAAYTAPRTESGRPELNGIWQVINTANYDLEAHTARPALAMRLGPGGPVPAAQVVALGAVGSVPAGLGVVLDGEIPYRPEMLSRKKENQEKWLERDPEIKCYLPGVPRATYMPMPFEILQSDSHIIIAYEYAGAARTIHMQDPGPTPIDSWMGQSVGRWDGETLVVTSDGFNDQTWFDRSGNFHSEALKVTERYTRNGPDQMQYEATIEDPNVFTRPWRIAMPVYRRTDPGIQLLEFKCVEFVEELIYGHLRKNPLSD